MTSNRLAILMLALITALFKVGCVSEPATAAAVFASVAPTASASVSERHQISVQSVATRTDDDVCVRIVARVPAYSCKLMSDDTAEVLLDLPQLTSCQLRLPKPPEHATRDYTLFIQDETGRKYERYSLVMTDRGLITRLQHLTQ